MNKQSAKIIFDLEWNEKKWEHNGVCMEYLYLHAKVIGLWTKKKYY